MSAPLVTPPRSELRDDSAKPILLRPDEDFAEMDALVAVMFAEQSDRVGH